ncbi:MAG: VWA domain-containing protein, partial [Oscillospiraceae bacterium]|nr:VWA domain-containing protein [Oscillospiraceae bacterium]
MKTRSIGQRMLSLLLSLALLVTWIPWSAMSAYAEPVLNVVQDSKKADPSTIDNWTNYFGPDKMDTEFAGAVWTDKSVYTAATNDLPGVTLDGENNFLVALSAVASNLSITGHTAAPTDTMLVLDMSGSMVDGTYEVGTVRRGNNYQTVNGIDMSLIEAMIEATNDTIDKLMKQNTNNRVGVVLYSGNTDSRYDATPDSAIVVLPLSRYASEDGKYLSVDTDWTTSTLYTWRSSGWFGGSWVESGEATYVATGTNVSVSVKDGLKTETGGDVTDRSKRAEGGTYIQNGLYQAMDQFLGVQDTIVPEGAPQAGAERLPVLVLMTDGAPTIATTSYDNVEDSNEGDGTNTTDRITFLTQLTAAYVRGRVAEHYQESSSDKKDVLFLTLGLGTENSTAATNTLYPAGSSDTLKGYWNTYLAATDGNNVQITSGQNGLRVERNAAVEAMNYVDKYFYADDDQGLLDSFEQILDEITLRAGSYTTLVEGSGADFSGYTSFEDGLGEMMHVLDVKGIIMGDKNGNKVLYTGKGVAESMNSGNLGSVDSPNERGDELVRTVKERIPGLTTTQAQQLIGHAYNDQQLYYVDDNNWSNYIGWYANADGEYVGFWDKDSGFENAPKDPQDPKKTAVYANRSYGYLGVDNENESDMMHVRVMVTTELETLEQTVSFQIPASLLPTVQYHVTLEEDDPNAVKSFTRDGAIPMQLVFEVGLRPDINSVNLEQKLAEHKAAGGHFHRDPVTGEVIFYTNEFSKGNDTNQNGIPDPGEVDDAVVTQSHFHPALDNTRYYYTENTKIYTTGDDLVTSQTRPTGEGYYYHRYIYSANGRQIINTPVAETTLKNDAVYDTQEGYWYIPAGTMYHNLQRFRTYKTENTTGTLNYSFFPAVFDSIGKQDVYTFLGNNGTFRLTPATGITLRKELQAAVDADTFTFRVTMTGVPVGKVAAPVITDANGDPLANVTMSQVQDGKFTVTMPADVTAYISGIPVETNVSVEELIDGDYHLAQIKVAGQNRDVNVPATTQIPAYTQGGSQMVEMVFTNAPNHYGDLVISKDIIHNLTSDPQAMATKEFTFRVKLEGSRIQAGDTFETDETGKKVKVGSDGYLTYEDDTLIKLKNEESITIYDIPEGTAYTVTEDALPGFRLDNIGGDQNISAATGAIVADTEVLADFYNRYPDQFDSVEVPVTLNVSKVLQEVSSYNGNETFRFALQMLRSNNTYPSITAENGLNYVEVAANRNAEGEYTLTFDKLGTYFFRVVELEPSPKTPGMTYSTMQALFRVEVTDAD